MHGLPDIGEVIDDTYEIISKLGAGGFGAVFLANHLPMDRQVALKMLLAHGPRPEEMVERFRREVMATRVLTHPNTVRIFDFRDSENHLLYYTMEYLRGDTLKGLVKGGGAQSPKRIKHILRQVLKSLSEAHSYGIIHRDLKPANIMLVEMHGETDFVKVLDFGIAKILDTSEEEDEDDPLTSAGMLVGTLRYMAPEQITGAQLGPMTDLYSLGLITAELLVGKSVFAGTGRWEVFQKQISEDPITLPPALVQSPMGPFLQKTLSKRPEERFATALEMLQALDALSDLSDLPLVRTGSEDLHFEAPDTGQSSSQVNHSGAFSNSAISVSHLSNGPAIATPDFEENAPTIVQDISSISEAIPVPAHQNTGPALPAHNASPKTIPLSAITPAHAPPQTHAQPHTQPLATYDPTPIPGVPTFDDVDYPAPAQQKSKLPLILGLLGVLLVGGGIGAVLLLGNSEQKSPINEPVVLAKTTPIKKVTPKVETPPEVDPPVPDKDEKPDAPKSRVIKITSVPQGAAFKFGDKTIGTTPFEYTYTAPVKLTVALKDHQPKTIELDASSEPSLSIKLDAIKRKTAPVKTARKTPKADTKKTNKTTRTTRATKTTKTKADTKKTGFINILGDKKKKKTNNKFIPMN